MSEDLTKFFRLLLLFLIALLPNMVHASSYAPEQAGQLLKVEPLGSYSKEQLDARFGQLGQARYGISVYRVEYLSLTPEAKPEPINLSGIVLVPEGASQPLPWISVQHGTIIPQGQAPSANPGLGFYEAAQGYMTLVADYIGYGSSRALLHPYLVAKGYTESGVHFLRAAQAFAQDKGLKLGSLYLQGYSEGGYATLALQKELEQHHAGEFAIAGSAPGAGPYDMEQLAVDGLRAATQNPLSTTFILLALQRWREPSLDLSQLINYEVPTLERLLRADTLDTEAVRQLPVATREFMVGEFLDDFITDAPKTSLARELRELFVEQSLNRDSWSPTVPTRFMHCQDDEVVAVAFTQNIVKHLAAVNPKAPVSEEILVSPDPSQPYRHGTCPLIFAPAAWFDTLRPASSGLSKVP